VAGRRGLSPSSPCCLRSRRKMLAYHVRVGAFQEHATLEDPDASVQSANRCVTILGAVRTALPSPQTFLWNGAH
jgi:hypothetical protein